MAKILAAFIVAASLLLALTGSAHAKTPAKTKDKTVHGTIASIRQDLISVTVEGDNNTSTRVTGQITNDTTITIKGQPATSSDLSRGETVDVTIKGSKVASITAAD